MKEYSKGIYVKFKPEEVEILHARISNSFNRPVDVCSARTGVKRRLFPNKQKCAGYIPGHCLPICKKERISIMVKNKVIENDTA